MKRKQKFKKTKFYVMFGFLQFARGILYCSKKLTQLIYNKIDHKLYRKKTSCVDPKAEKWAKYNNWFGEDIYMTNAAFKIHRELVEFEGIDPKSKKYYNEIDKRIYDQFKERIKKYYSTDN